MFAAEHAGFKVLAIYIPFWLYSNSARLKIYRSFKKIYIPFWLYSNRGLCCIGPCGNTFTFHSGYIQMSFSVPPNTFNAAFTFHSGYIQIVRSGNILLVSLHLHSILVIFKLFPIDLVGMTIHILTFHSGYIQMVRIY